jgi:hypothetical protein
MESGKIANKIFEPSSGGSGTRLNTMSIKLAYTTIARYETTGLAAYSVACKTRKIKAVAAANKKLAAGPAKPTSAGPHFWFLRL